MHWHKITDTLWRSDCDRVEIIKSEVDGGYTVMFIGGHTLTKRFRFLESAIEVAEGIFAEAVGV